MIVFAGPAWASSTFGFFALRSFLRCLPSLHAIAVVRTSLAAYSYTVYTGHNTMCPTCIGQVAASTRATCSPLSCPALLTVHRRALSTLQSLDISVRGNQLLSPTPVVLTIATLHFHTSHCAWQCPTSGITAGHCILAVHIIAELCNCS